MCIRHGLIVIAALAMGCGGAKDDSGGDYFANGDSNVATNGVLNTNNAGADEQNVDPNNDTIFVPEVEEFVIQAVASTQRYVFVPNSSEEGSTVAQIDGTDLSVTPIPVGLNPADVVAFDTPTGDAVAVVLVAGTDNVAIIRADAGAQTPSELVRLISIPGEVNALRAAGDGRHVLAYIDPDRPLPTGASVASLQAAALVRIGESREDDAVFELSVTRLIRDVETVEAGDQFFVVGREGVNRIEVGDIASDAFVPPLALGLSDDAFPPQDLEVEVADDASFLVVRSSEFAGLAIHEVADTTAAVQLPLPNIPTDIDLFADGERRLIVAAIRDANALVLIDVDEAMANPETYEPEQIDVSGSSAGLSQLTPDLNNALLYSTLPLLPTMGVLSFDTLAVREYPLRNAIRSVAVSPDSKSAVVVHDVREDATSAFQLQHGLTVFDIASGYTRPISLSAEPVDTVMTTGDDDTAYVFMLLDSANENERAVVRVNLRTFRSDTVPLARPPRQIGLVAQQIFVAQEATEGRITFVDTQTLAQRTVSGYELNAGID